MICKEDCFHLGVKALIQNADGKLLLLQKNIKSSHPKQVWDLPGGRIHRNELLEDALKREVFEETGLTNIAEIRPFNMALSPIRIRLQEGEVGLILSVYLCSLVDTSPQIQLSEEHLDYIWALPSEASNLLSANHSAELMEKIGQLPIVMKA